MIKENKTEVIVKPGVQEVLVTREFNAPREWVFKAFTDAELCARWIGPRELSPTVEIFEPHLGIIQMDTVGNEFAF